MKVLLFVLFAVAAADLSQVYLPPSCPQCPTECPPPRECKTQQCTCEVSSTICPGPRKQIRDRITYHHKLINNTIDKELIREVPFANIEYLPRKVPVNLHKTKYRVESDRKTRQVPFIKETVKHKVITKQKDHPLFEYKPIAVPVANYKDISVPIIVEVPEIIYKDIPVAVEIPIANNVTEIVKIKKTVIRKEFRIKTTIKYNDIEAEKVIYIPNINMKPKQVKINVQKPINCTKAKEVPIKIETPELKPNPQEIPVMLHDENVNVEIIDKRINKTVYTEVLDIIEAEPEPIYKRVPLIEQFVEFKPTINEIPIPFFSTKVIDKPIEGERTKTTVEVDCSYQHSCPSVKCPTCTCDDSYHYPKPAIPFIKKL